MLLNYSPQSCDPELLLRCTVGESRLWIIETLLAAVRHEIGGPAHQHQILIGPRGSGKTHVLALVVNRMRTEAGLSKEVLPVRLPEEATAGQPADLVAQIIAVLAQTLDREPGLLGAATSSIAALCRTRMDRIRALHDDREALILAFDSLEEVAAKAGRLVVGIVENFDSLLYSGASRGRASRETPQWALRKELQERRGLLLLAAAPTSFGEIRDAGAPFHDFFREHELGELSRDEMVAMIRARVDVELGNPDLDERARRRLQSLKADLPRREPALRGVLTLAGGLPRFGHLLFDVVVETEIASSFRVLSRFLDEQTPYFQSWLNPRLIPARELAVLDHIAAAEGPRTPTQISRDLRGFPVNAVAMCLRRLLERRLVRKRPEGRKEVRYDVAEPLLRVWRRFRTGRGEQDRLLLLADFVAALYEPVELLAERHLIAQSSPDASRLQLLDFALRRHEQVPVKTGAEPRSEIAAEEAEELRSAAEAEFMHGNLRHAADLMQKAVGAIERTGDQTALALALGRLSRMTLMAGDPEGALQAALRGETLVAAAGHDLGRASCIESRGDVLFRLGDNAAAREAYDEAEALFQKVGEDLGRANCIRSRGDVLLQQGDPAAARSAYDEAEALFQKVGYDLGRANCISSRGSLLFRLGDNAAARGAYDEAEALYQRIGSDLGRANCIRSRGDVLLQLGDPAAARSAYDEAETLYQKIGSDLGRANCIRSRGGVLLQLGDPAAARSAYDEAEALYQKVGDDLGRANCIEHRGDVLFRLGDNEAASKAYDEAEALHEKVGSDLGRANCLSDRGRALARLAEWEQGLKAVLQGLELARKVDARSNVPLIMRDLLAILEADMPVGDLPHLGRYLNSAPDLPKELASDERLRAAYSRLATSVVRRLPGEAAVGPIRDMIALLPEAYADLLKPAVLAAQVRAGTLSATLPAEPEEVRRVVRMILEG